MIEGNPKYFGRSLSQCHFDHRKFHTQPTALRKNTGLHNKAREHCLRHSIIEYNVLTYNGNTGHIACEMTILKHNNSA
jgi:hypothetical protein